MKIFHAPRSRSLRVLWAAEELGAPYETAAASFARPDPEFLEANPAGTLPAMVDGDVVMTESVAIMQYLGAKHGPTPLVVEPGDPRYPDYLQFMMFGEASLAAPLNAVVGTKFMAPEDQKDNFTVNIIKRSFHRRLPLVERQLKRGDYMAGNEFTLADISVGYALGLADMLELGDVAEPIKAYAQRLTSRPAYQRAVAVA
ncbi:glutathione S-transferase family protein [Phenylobacterium sp.]|jgi:glutathione S-transferase|uniref:glutathione S-transferase family protein n=1 Tax=Phenylobacterium sp. TaxID=1871053 RepID=UPI002E304A83|nr:glutathione S-transferase family protein [Phenylobacterium sp.]HEX2559539.1 glutathione S-transferase family protein [Phenylobacterium sp.]